MSRLVTPICAVLFVLSLTISLVPVSGQVTWAHTLDDAPGDVVNLASPTVPVTGKDHLDILSATIVEAGEDLNVSLRLAGACDEAADYLVEVICDGDDSRKYSFSYSFGIFTITGFDLTVSQPEAYISEDGTLVSWVVAKDRISATSSTEVLMAEATHLAGLATYMDIAGTGGGGGGSDGPPHVEVLVDVRTVEHVRLTFATLLEAAEAREVRTSFDDDLDGQISSTEYEAGLEALLLGLQYLNRTAMTLDGAAPSEVDISVSLEGILGPTDSASPLTQEVTLDLTYTEATRTGTHTYTGGWGEPAGEADMWFVTPDSSYTVRLPQGWRFETDGWPKAMKAFVSDEGDEMSLSGEDMRTHWNDTLGESSAVTIRKASSGDDEKGDSPGPSGAVAASVLILAIPLALMPRRPRIP